MNARVTRVTSILTVCRSGTPPLPKTRCGAAKGSQVRRIRSRVPMSSRENGASEFVVTLAPRSIYFKISHELGDDPVSKTLSQRLSVGRLGVIMRRVRSQSSLLLCDMCLDRFSHGSVAVTKKNSLLAKSLLLCQVCVVLNNKGVRVCTVCKSPYKASVRLPGGESISLFQSPLPPPYICFMVVTRHQNNEVRRSLSTFVCCSTHRMR